MDTVEASGGGAKHRSMEPHTEWDNVADPHAAATIRQGGDLALMTPRTSYDTVDPITVCEAPVW